VFNTSGGISATSFSGNGASLTSLKWSNITDHAANVKSDLGITSGGTTFLRQDGQWVTPPGGGTGNSNVYEDEGSATTLIDGFYVDSANLTNGPSGLWTNSKKLVVPSTADIQAQI
jgi:hypothetical protein